MVSRATDCEDGGKIQGHAFPSEKNQMLEMNEDNENLKKKKKKIKNKKKQNQTVIRRDRITNKLFQLCLWVTSKTKEQERTHQGSKIKDNNNLLQTRVICTKGRTERCSSALHRGFRVVITEQFGKTERISEHYMHHRRTK